jgi:capsular polysaccharide biosynthesis protein
MTENEKSFLQNDDEDTEIELLELANLLLHNALWIVGAALVAALLCLAVCKFCLTPRYEASIELIVNSRQDNTSTVTNDNINSAKSLTSAYAIVIKSNIVLDEVIEALGLDMSYSQLAGTISVASVDSTQIMKVTVENEDPQLAGEIVQTIAEIAPDRIVDLVEAGSCKIVSKVMVNTTPVFPTTRKFVLIAALAAACLVSAALILQHLLHNYIEDDEDVQRELNIPVLGLLPEV